MASSSFSQPPVKVEPGTSLTTSSSRAGPSSFSRSTTSTPDVKPLQSDDLGYSDYRLVSTGTGGWQFNVAKFATLKEVDVPSLPRPILLNRKDPRPRPPPPPMGVDGQPIEELKPVLDIHGKPMMGPDGQPIYATGKKGPAADLSLIAPFAGAVRNKKNLFKKKTKQIHKVSQDRIRLRREERHPWVLEAGENGKDGAWVGRMADTATQSYMLFVFEDEKDAFQVIDVHRWYKFQQKPAYTTIDGEEAETMYAKTLKGKDPSRWIMHDPNRPTSTAAGSSSGSGLSSSTSTRIVKAEITPPAWLGRAQASLGASSSSTWSGGGGGVRVKKEELMDWEDDGGDDGGPMMRRGEGGGDAGGDGDQDFEDAFSDDDGLIEFDQADEAENKELEERIKREFRAGNAGLVDEAASDDDDLFGDEALKEDGKKIKKKLKKTDRNYDSDDDDNVNPYASSEESSDSDDEPPPPPAPSLQTPVTTADGQYIPPPKAPVVVPPSSSSSSKPSSSSADRDRHSRHASPASALLAQRSISPPPPRPRSNSVTSSPKPVRSRSGSPAASMASDVTKKRKGSPDVGEGEKKQRMEQGTSVNEGGGSQGSPVPATTPARVTGGGPTRENIVEYIRRATPTIQVLVKHFKTNTRGRTPEETTRKRGELIAIVKSVADMNGQPPILTLKEGL